MNQIGVNCNTGKANFLLSLNLETDLETRLLTEGQIASSGLGKTRPFLMIKSNIFKIK